MSPFPFLATVVVTFLISSLWAHIVGPVGSSFFSFFGFSWAASANLERAGFALDWIGITNYYYYYLDWKGNGNKQQHQKWAGLAVVYISILSHIQWARETGEFVGRGGWVVG